MNDGGEQTSNNGNQQQQQPRGNQWMKVSSTAKVTAQIAAAQLIAWALRRWGGP